MSTPLAQHRALESLKAAQRATHEQRRHQAQEASASTWWSEAKPTRCLICHAEVPTNYQPGQELPCGH